MNKRYFIQTLELSEFDNNDILNTDILRCIWNI